MTRRRMRWGGGGGWVAMALLLLPAGVAGQQSQADSTRLAEADSARARILRQLTRLARPPGADSALYVQDSIAREEGLARPASTPDSVLTELLRMPRYGVTEYEGGKADFDAAQRVLVLLSEEGKRARVRGEGMEVEADSSITFNEKTGLVRARGNATSTPEKGDPVESAGLVYDLERGVGSAADAKTSFQQGSAKWVVRGDMPLATQDSSFLSHAIFTSCELDVPHYHFETDEIKIIGGGIMVARPVRLYFADVPVAWLPFIAQSTSRGRASGILTPRFSVNDIVRNAKGYRRRLSNVGFYWAMSDYSDAIVALDWFSDTFLALTGSFNYRFNRQFLDGNLNVRRYWSSDGTTQYSLDTRHSWAYDERTQLRLSSRFTSSTDFLRDNSFNPTEVTQSINSEGGVSRRFDWGSLSVSANRQEYLSDDRVEWTLPSANLSLSSITLFRAPQNRAHAWNNMTVGGSARFTRNTSGKKQGLTFDPSLVDTEKQTASMSTTLSMGNLSFSQSLKLDESSELGIPEAYLLYGDSADEADLVTDAPARTITEQSLSWNTSLDYQQQLIGSTTLTPRLSISGNSFKSDTEPLASSFVAAPTRVSFGASLKTDIYGFFPGFGGYETIRHKFSPSFSYEWSPEVKPTELQKDVFRSQALQARNAMSVTLNQTFEAKRAQPDSAQNAGGQQQSGSGPRAAQTSQIVQLLGIRTSVVNYDFVQADSSGFFLAGFQTTRLSNTISSDFLQGLSVSMDHDLFEDEIGDDGRLASRSFAPHLSSVNLGFSLNSNSGIFRLLGFGGGDQAQQQQVQEEEEPAPADAFTSPGVDESSIIPGTSSPGQQAAQPRAGGRGGAGWQANLSYALQRPRDPDALASQVINGTITLHPTAQWDLNWRTSYDLERGSFNDHTIRLTRDLHRWQAHFDFLQTATGNWQFRFEVSLTDNQELKFDYQQRNLDAGQRYTNY